jgi:hypothetical protein
LRAILDEVCENVSRSKIGARTHVASKILEAAIEVTHLRTTSGKSRARLYRKRRPCGADRPKGGVNFQVTVLKIPAA